MRLRASFVVENAFIAPLFTLIIAALMSICLYIRDSIVVENGILIASMKAEQEIRKNGQANEENKRIVNAAKDYIQDNVVVMKDIDDDSIAKEINKKYIKDNYPPDFIRMVNAVQREKNKK